MTEYLFNSNQVTANKNNLSLAANDITVGNVDQKLESECISIQSLLAVADKDEIMDRYIKTDIPIEFYKVIITAAAICSTILGIKIPHIVFSRRF